MNANERAVALQIYELHLTLLESQRNQIAELRRAQEALQESHETIGELLKHLGELARLPE